MAYPTDLQRLISFTFDGITAGFWSTSTLKKMVTFVFILNKQYNLKTVCACQNATLLAHKNVYKT
jgi:hypothetical protein